MEFEFGELIVDEELEFGELELDVITQTPPLINLEVTPTNKEQVFNHEGSYGYDEVRVKAVTGETLNIIPSKEEQRFNGIYTEVNVDGLVTSALNIIPTTEEQSFEGLYEKVTAHPVTNEIDSNIVPENIAEGKTILGVQGNFKGGKFAPRYISFYRCDQANIDDELANLDLSNITSASYMFDSSNKLTSINWTNQNAPNLTSVSYFASNNRSGLKTVDLSNWNVPNVESASNMFVYDQVLTRVSLKGWSCPKLKNVMNMFSMTNKLVFVDIRDLTFDNIPNTTSNYQYMFSSSYHKNTEIIVKGETEKAWLLEKFNFLTKVKTLAEYQAEGGV